MQQQRPTYWSYSYNHTGGELLIHSQNSPSPRSDAHQGRFPRPINVGSGLVAPDAELPSGELKKGQLRIAPLIVMTVEDLEDLETSVEHFRLRDFLDDYSRSCADRLISLRSFIAFSKYGQHMYHNRNVAANGLEILQRTQETVFPTAGGESG